MRIMFLTSYFSCHKKEIQFSRQQASHFAKKVAGDFNPIHDEDSSRFCVPGDLLFAVLLKKKGISEKMQFTFSGMVNDSTVLHIESKPSMQKLSDEECTLVDSKGKEYLRMNRSGQINHNKTLIEHVVTNYVQFSAMNFPHIMVPLMKEAQLMFNCQRPLVIYESMEVEFDHLDLSHPNVEFVHATFDVEGKRGIVTLHFTFQENGKIIGRGTKRMITSGLRPYQQNEINEFVNRFDERKAAFLGL